jgi:hypothetical protein
MDLIPLQRSAEYDAIESEFKALFLSLYKKFLADKVHEIALYPTPHLASDEFISMLLGRDGLALVRGGTNESIRYLLHAWRYNNPQRGTMFLDTYLRSLFGGVNVIDQMYCPVDGNYPADMLSKDELLRAGGDLEDYFLTSRFRVDVDTDLIPQQVLAAARSAVAARFVLLIRVLRRTTWQMGMAMVAGGAQVVRIKGTIITTDLPVASSTEQALPAASGGATVFYSQPPRRNMQSHLQ